MTRTYALNTEAAKGAEGGRIDQTGAYVGILTVAEAVTSTKNTEGVEFTFKAEDGRTAEYMTLWTHNKDGKELYGFKVLNALMACCALRTITPSAATLTKRAKDGGTESVKATVFSEFHGKRVGLLLQREEYEKTGGGIGSRMVISTPFCAETKRTASEILTKNPKAEALERLKSSLRDRPLQGQRTPAAASASHGPAPTGDYDDSDIPF